MSEGTQVLVLLVLILALIFGGWIYPAVKHGSPSNTVRQAFEQIGGMK